LIKVFLEKSQRRLGMDYKISDEGIKMLKVLEGFRHEIYLDAAERKTIGYGHLIKKGELGGFEEGISKEQAEGLLRDDLEFVEKTLNKAIPFNVLLLQNMYDALCIFLFNIPSNLFLQSTMLKKLKEGNISGAGLEFERWVYITNPNAKGKEVCQGLKNRRAKEKRLYSTGAYSFE
jgi:lysozyme